MSSGPAARASIRGTSLMGQGTWMGGVFGFGVCRMGKETHPELRSFRLRRLVLGLFCSKSVFKGNRLGASLSRQDANGGSFPHWRPASTGKLASSTGVRIMLVSLDKGSRIISGLQTTWF